VIIHQNSSNCLLDCAVRGLDLGAKARLSEQEFLEVRVSRIFLVSE